MSLLIALGLAGALIQSAVAPPRAAISGRVLEDGSRMPIAGAQLMLMSIPSRSGRAQVPFPDRPRTAITDHDGRYEFDDLEAGRYQITVQKAGFALLPGSPEVDLKAGERRGDVNVMLQKGAVIVGRVLDEAGEPLVDTRVLAMRKPAVPPSGNPIRGDLLIPAGPGAQTNDLGEFRLFSLPPGEYYVQVMPRHDFGGSPAPRATTMLPTYFPGTADPAAALPISVGAGQTSGDVVIRMIGVPAFHVSGLVLDEAGRPVVNAMVRLELDEPAGRPMFMMGHWNQSRTDTSGKFTINNVTNGTYTLLAAAPVVISGPADGRRGSGVAVSGGSFTSFGGGVSFARETSGGGVTTETSNGTTIQYRDDTATRVPIAVNQANLSGLEVIVKRPGR
jgi:hypothetical protein